MNYAKIFEYFDFLFKKYEFDHSSILLFYNKYKAQFYYEINYHLRLCLGPSNHVP